MGYHSADYNHDWKIGVAELVRVTVLASTTNLGITTGCYKVDDTSIDGFAPDNTRAISDPVTLTKYHSADYNQDGRIDAGELARVTELYNFRYEDLNASGFVRTGQYHSDDPLTVDGFGLGPVYLSAYAFDTDHKPFIYANIVPSGDYILRAKFIDGSPTSFQSTTTHSNNGLVLDVLPPAGVYNVDLYWVSYNVDGTVSQISNACKALVTVSDPPASTERCALANCICGALSQEEEDATDPDKGQCFPYREKRSCNVPTVPVAECADTEAYPIFTPGAIPPFYVVARLFDSLCEPITDQDDNPILTIIK